MSVLRKNIILTKKVSSTMNDVELTVEQQTAAELLNLGPVVMATMAGGVLCIELRHSLYSWKWDKFLSRWIEIT
jgi:hypothetical protein